MDKSFVPRLFMLYCKLLCNTKCRKKTLTFTWTLESTGKMNLISSTSLPKKDCNISRLQIILVRGFCPLKIEIAGCPIGFLDYIRCNHKSITKRTMNFSLNIKNILTVYLQYVQVFFILFVRCWIGNLHGVTWVQVPNSFALIFLVLIMAFIT